MNTIETDRSYSARLDLAARRASRRAQIASGLQAKFLAAALDSPDAMVPTPGLRVKQRPISWLLSEEIDEADLAALLRDAAKGQNVEVRAQLLLSVLAHTWADGQADLALEEAEAEGL